MNPFFPDTAITYEGPDSDNPLAYRWYDPRREVLGKSMADQLRFAICYWHTFGWQGKRPVRRSNVCSPLDGCGRSDGRR